MEVDLGVYFGLSEGVISFQRQFCAGKGGRMEQGIVLAVTRYSPSGFGWGEAKGLRFRAWV